MGKLESNLIDSKRYYIIVPLYNFKRAKDLSQYWEQLSNPYPKSAKPFITPVDEIDLNANLIISAWSTTYAMQEGHKIFSKIWMNFHNTKEEIKSDLCLMAWLLSQNFQIVL